MTGNPVQTGPYTVILENEVIAAADRFSDILSNLGQVNSPINDFNIFQSLSYLSRIFQYTNQYSQMGTHNPEEFFTRLFRNKYEQEASPVQIARGVEVIKNSGRTQVQFLNDFALENAVLAQAPIIILRQKEMFQV